MKKVEVCGAPGCGRPSAKGLGRQKRSIGGVSVCRGCYQRAWLHTGRGAISLREFKITKLPTPNLLPPANKATCARKGCETSFEEGERDATRRRYIGDKTVCRPCYQNVWEVAKARRISIARAFAALPAKRRKH